jgi:hypothetical protein
MDVIGHVLSTLAILGTISGVAIPGLFMAVVAPVLDWILPVRQRRSDGR